MSEETTTIIVEDATTEAEGNIFSGLTDTFKKIVDFILYIIDTIRGIVDTAMGKDE